MECLLHVAVVFDAALGSSEAISTSAGILCAFEERSLYGVAVRTEARIEECHTYWLHNASF